MQVLIYTLNKQGAAKPATVNPDCLQAGSGEPPQGESFLLTAS